MRLAARHMLASAVASKSTGYGAGGDASDANQQNQRMKLAGGCNAIESRNLKIGSCSISTAPAKFTKIQISSYDRFAQVASGAETFRCSISLLYFLPQVSSR